MTAHFTPNPEFPDRPNHPDFWLISKVVNQHDDMCDAGTEEDSGFAKTILCDIPSLAYFAKERTKRAVELLQDTAEEDEKASTQELGIMLWIDAFTAGQRFAQLQGDGVVATPEGNRRQRRSRRR